MGRLSNISGKQTVKIFYTTKKFRSRENYHPKYIKLGYTNYSMTMGRIRIKK
ncbi:MAG: hypothetical protein RLZZ86_2681 [Cyanobacteriota bacterium]|jgi:hypothetical protein